MYELYLTERLMLLVEMMQKNLQDVWFGCDANTDSIKTQTAALNSYSRIDLAILDPRTPPAPQGSSQLKLYLDMYAHIKWNF